MNETLMPDVSLTAPDVLDSLSDALLTLSSQGSIICANAAGRKLMDAAGRNPRKLADFLFAELDLGSVFVKNDATPIQNRKISLGNGVYIVRALLRDGRLILILDDVTDVKNMAKDISAYLGQLARFRMAGDLLPDGIVIADAFENIVFTNQTMRELLASRNARLESNHLSELEAIFGTLPVGDEGLCVFEGDDAAPKEDSRLLIEKRKLFSNGRVLGMLLRFSRKYGSGGNGYQMKKSADTPGADAPARSAKKSRAAGAAPGRSDRGVSYSLSNFVGQSKTVLTLKDIIRKVAVSSSTVLLQSESGTGKELLAHSLHELSERVDGPFIKLNCASLPESLLEAEVFGYDSGAFTGAKKSGNPGLFEQAHTGTIFLDEIGEMSLPLQAKLLRIIQEKEVQRLGGQDSKRLDVRVVCATNRNLLDLVEQGKFRSDLLFRLNVVSISIPPLRDRKEDIKSLIIHYLREYSGHFKKRVSGVSKEVYYLFMHYEWPGNVRELGNILEYAFNIIDGATIELKHLPQYIFESNKLSGSPSGRLDNIVGEYSARVIKSTLEQYNGNKAAAASALGVSRSKLYRLLGRK